MNFVEPARLLERLALELPTEVREHIVLVGSLAAAYHYRGQLANAGVRTKDADLLLRPRGVAVEQGRIATTTLQRAGWRVQTDYGGPRATPHPIEALPAIRLYPPDSFDYFVEFLTVPPDGSDRPKEWLEIELPDGWWGLPSLRYLGLTAWSPLISEPGIPYARPSTMALANLLSHKALDSDVISKPLGGRAIKRCNKDLGRVLALARLEGESYLDWLVDWKRALATNLPGQTQSLSRSVGSGLRALVASAADFDEAWFTCTIGLLSGANVSKDQLMITAQRTLGDLIEPFENME